MSRRTKCVARRSSPHVGWAWPHSEREVVFALARNFDDAALPVLRILN